MQGTAMDNGLMPYGYLVANDRLRFLVSTMNHGPILDIDLIAYADTVDIAPDYSVKPDTAIIAQDHITGQRGIGCQKTVFADYRVLAFNMKNISHSKEFSCAENVLHRSCTFSGCRKRRKSSSKSGEPKIFIGL
jgi:hypothetical protein